MWTKIPSPKRGEERKLEMADIRHAILIDAAPDAIHDLVASGAGFSRWWATDIASGPSGTTDLGFFNRSTVYSLKPLCNEPLDVRWRCESGQEWVGTELRFRLTPKGKQTQLHFWHAGWQSETDYFISCNTTWGELMFRLKAAAEGHEKGPLFAANGMAY